MGIVHSKMASSLLFVLAAVTVAAAVSLPYHSEELIVQFEEFIKIHNKKYDSDIEKAFRFGIFLKTLDFIDHLNKISENATYGITQFTDLTDEEFKRWNTGLMQSSFGEGCQPYSGVSDVNLTETNFDWRDSGVVSSPKQQGGCGSCWAFSVMGNVESINAIKTKNLVSLSEQQLVDCDTTSNGCVSGFIQNGLSYLVSNGAMLDADYPYVEHQGSCQYDQSKVSIKVSNCYSISVSEDELAQKLQELGPLSIAIDSSLIQHFNGGIVRGPTCKGSKLDHAVLLIGFGEDNGEKYWILKNSWGEGWGDQGFFKMDRGINCCLIAGGPAYTAVI